MAGDIGITTDSFVGVKIEPGKSPDFSHALRVLPNAEIKISDPIVNRLRGPFLVDPEVEAHYKNYDTALKKMEGEGTAKIWLASLLNAIQEPTGEPITPSDLDKMKVVHDSPEIQSLAHQYGHSFVRPYFQFNLGDYQKVYKKLTGHLGSNGVTITGGAIETDPVTTGIALVIACNLDGDTIHEIGHTLDTNRKRRHPKDEVIEEFATYYRDTYVAKLYASKTTHRDETGAVTSESVSTREVYENMDRIRNTLKSDLYQKYGSAFKSPEEYGQAVDHIAEVITALEKHMDKQEVNKVIYNSVSAFELNHLLEVLQRENKN